MNVEQEQKLNEMNANLKLDISDWIDDAINENLDPDTIPYPAYDWMEFGTHKKTASKNRKPDRILDGSYCLHDWVSENKKAELTYDIFEQNSPWYVFRRQIEKNSNWYDLLDMADMLIMESTDKHHRFLTNIKPHPQYNNILEIFCDS